MVSLESIKWDDLINYSPHTELKNRKKVLIKLNDEYNRIYFSVIVKHDRNKNVHIRYLDNPSAGNLWWTGNEVGLCGLDKRQYCCKLLGDVYDDMGGLKINDFCEDGYDDIINFEKESDRFFKTSSEYPYLDGLYGNIYIFEYFMKLYENNEKKYFDDNCDILPDNILLDIGNPNYVRESIFDIVHVFIIKSNYIKKDILDIKGYISLNLNTKK